MKTLLLYLILHIGIIMPVRSQISSLSEELIHSTIRIECEHIALDAYGKRSIVPTIGTGFIFSFKSPESDSLSFPVIVTNKHVVYGAVKGKFQFTRMDELGNPLYGQKEEIVIADFQNYWIPHPDPDVDLCIMPIAPIINAANEKSSPIFYKSFDESLIPDDSIWQSFTAIEDIIMIGYPIGLWDSKNNLPIVRTGQTATPLKIDYQGKKEFLVDIPSFPGSSGSPVILYNQGYYSTGSGITLGTRLYLIGVLYAGPIFNAQGKGEITIDKVPIDVITNTGVPINIGVVIKSNELFILKKELLRIIEGD